MATIQKQGRGYKITVSQGYDYTGKRIRQNPANLERVLLGKKLR